MIAPRGTSGRVTLEILCFEIYPEAIDGGLDILDILRCSCYIKYWVVYWPFI